jgi:predicted component of type VI protein secretion system
MKLVVEDEGGARSELPFPADEITVGRAAEGVTLRLPERNVSRRHARFSRQKGDVWVEDLGSLVGTFVNGDRIQGRRRLRPGDIVQIGDYDLAVLQDAADLAGAPRPDARTVEPTTALAPAEIRALAAGSAPAAPAAAFAAPAARTAPRARMGAILAAGAVALLVGLAAGWIVGKYALPPAPPAPSTASR